MSAAGKASELPRADPQGPIRRDGRCGILGDLRGMAQKAQQAQDLEEGEFMTLLQQLRRQISGWLPSLAGHR